MARFLLLLGAAFAVLAWRLSRKPTVEITLFEECEAAIMGCVLPRGHFQEHVNADGSFWSWT